MIATTLTIALIELALIIVEASAPGVLIALEDVLRGRLVYIEVGIQMLPALIAIILAWHSCDPTTRVSYQGLWVTFRSHVHIHIKVL